MIPSLANVDAEWEHMTRCIIEGLRYVIPGLTYESALMYVCWVLDLKTPVVCAAITTRNHFRFKFMRFVMTWVIRLPGVRRFMVWGTCKRMKKLNEASDEFLENVKAKAESYPSTIKVRA